MACKLHNLSGKREVTCFYSNYCLCNRNYSTDLTVTCQITGVTKVTNKQTKKKQTQNKKQLIMSEGRC